MSLQCLWQPQPFEPHEGDVQRLRVGQLQQIRQIGLEPEVNLVRTSRKSGVKRKEPEFFLIQSRTFFKPGD